MEIIQCINMYESQFQNHFLTGKISRWLQRESRVGNMYFDWCSADDGWKACRYDSCLMSCRRMICIRFMPYVSLLGSENEYPFSKQSYHFIRANNQALTLGMIRVLQCRGRTLYTCSRFSHLAARVRDPPSRHHFSSKSEYDLDDVPRQSKGWPVTASVGPLDLMFTLYVTMMSIQDMV